MGTCAFGFSIQPSYTSGYERQVKMTFNWVKLNILKVKILFRLHL